MSRYVFDLQALAMAYPPPGPGYPPTNAPGYPPPLGGAYPPGHQVSSTFSKKELETSPLNVKGEYFLKSSTKS